MRTRVWTAGRHLVLVAALGLTYGVFFLAALRVATHAREVRVPDVRGRSVTEAGADLARAGLALKIDSVRRPDPKIPADHVLTQDPEPGVVLRRQRAVRIRVSDGQRDPQVPSVLGQAERAAEITLTDAHVNVSARAEIRTADYATGTVVAQDPPPRSRAAAVTLLLNRGESTTSYVMPDLIGVLQGLAVDVLRKNGFRVSVVAEVPYPGLPAGIVVHQTPQAGFQIASGEPIALEVSK